MASALWMLLAAFLFAVLGAFVQLATPDMGTMGIVCYRGIFAVMTIWAWAAWVGQSVRTRQYRAHCIRSFLGVLSMSFWLWSLSKLPLGTSMTLTYTTPLFMAAGVLIYDAVKHIRPEWSLAIASIVGFAGVAMVMQPEFTTTQLWGVAAGLASALLGAITAVQIRQLAQLHEPSWRVVFYFSALCIPVGLIGHFAWEPALHVDWTTVWYAVGIGLSATVAQIAVTKAWSGGNLLVNAIVQYAGILFGAAIGAILYGDTVSLRAALGMLIIVGTGVFATMQMKHGKKKVASR